MLASGVTAIAGFGVLILSSITMLREFGFVTVIDLAVSLFGVLLVLPAVLAFAQPCRPWGAALVAAVPRASRAAGARRSREHCASRTSTLIAAAGIDRRRLIGALGICRS